MYNIRHPLGISNAAHSETLIYELKMAIRFTLLGAVAWTNGGAWACDGLNNSNPLQLAST